MGLLIELPDDVVRAIRLPKAEVPARVKRELAVALYAKDLLSFGKARQLAEMTYGLMCEHGFFPTFKRSRKASIMCA